MRVARRNQKLMDFTTGILLPLLFGGAGIFTILRLVRRIQARAYLKDAVVVITGATSGLGKECAKAFHAAGSQLVLCGRSGERLQDVLQELSAAADPLKNGHKHHMVVFDLSDIKAVVSAAKEILSCVDHVDILINNAGISYRGTIIETVIEVDRKVMETNYFGPVALTKALLPAMIKRRKGHIVTISSVQGKISIPFRSAYAASKHATQAFFDCLRAEVERFNIEVTVVSPGYIQTNLSLNAVTSDGSQYGGEAKVLKTQAKDRISLLHHANCPLKQKHQPVTNVPSNTYKIYAYWNKNYPVETNYRYIVIQPVGSAFKACQQSKDNVKEKGQEKQL
ncbi:dehydrogenase/reductase SDR family member 7B isoform X2 [Ahaetulla prasina]|uniref:dehydrogenase/reductase SDR family member 7B isoform X2 n=1 Tax=Ahaetulla prasina TaxID=499056 RepID=UPI002647151E|nr:dehydrogenase/reductase SDR family member 7B isoform X2 [Ahaetulla prasina]